MTSDQELWAVALWVEKQHPDDGTDYIECQVKRLMAEEDEDGVRTWLKIADRFCALQPTGAVSA